MTLLDAVKLLDAVAVAGVLGAWVRYLINRNMAQREHLREQLQQWQRWYREDIKSVIETLEDQQRSQERQQAQTEALIDEMDAGAGSTS